jgi:phenylalanyl-tRNA synthetase beta chain
MIFSEQWIREWVNPSIDTAGLMEQLTMAGLEVDGSAPVANFFSGIVVGEVLSVDAHPDADKLSVCRVSDGDDELQVVCGAPNVRAGMKAPFARLGAEIHAPDSDKPFVIKQAKLRGLDSSGMLCSAEELGLEESSDGLLELMADAPVGEDIREYLKLDDTSIELDLTPNRGDCLCIAGLAREIGTLYAAEVCAPQIEPMVASIDDVFKVDITAADQCPRYLGRVIRGIDPSAETPLWMQEKLRRCGLRSIDPVVDVTNFVLIELGQPMHAFDLGKLHGAIDVRLAREGEKITLLDGKEVAMSSDTLVIADQSGPVAMAGIMGGAGTAVGDDTRDVFLECAFFAPLAIAGKARSYGLHTDASHRYERGVDYQLQWRATERATQLLLDIVGGEAGPIEESLGNLPQAREVTLQYESVPRFLGVALEREHIKDILQRLGLKVASESETAITLGVPSYRFDIEIEADLIEELARVHGYNNIPPVGGMGRQVLTARREGRLPIQRVRQHLVAFGYQEVVTYSFIDPKLSKLLCGESASPVALQNPISADMSVMRSSLLPGLVATLKYNENRQQERMRLFETGQVFSELVEGFAQPTMLAGLVSGSQMPKNWSNSNKIIDFYDVKGDIESLLALGASVTGFEFVPSHHTAMHGGQCAEIRHNGKAIGYVGAIHPSIKREMDLNSDVFVFELQLDALLERQIPAARPLSRHPEVTRDLAVLVDNETSAADILASVRENAGDFLTELRLFDVYQGDAVESGKKSLALGLTWQHPSRTLNDDEVNEIIACCIKALEEKFEARLRN